MCGEEEVNLHTSLTSALHKGEWSLLLPSSFIPDERDPSVLLIAAWVDLSSNLKAVAKRGLFL